jgi:hypothetical protein
LIAVTITSKFQKVVIAAATLASCGAASAYDFNENGASDSAAHVNDSSQTTCQDQVALGWSSIRPGNSSDFKTLTRIATAEKSTRSLILDNRRWLPIPNGKIKTVATTEERGALKTLIFASTESGWSMSIDWPENYPIGGETSSFLVGGQELPANQVELLKWGVKRVGSPINCLVLADYPAAVAIAEVAETGLNLASALPEYPLPQEATIQ